MGQYAVQKIGPEDGSSRYIPNVNSYKTAWRYTSEYNPLLSVSFNGINRLHKNEYGTLVDGTERGQLRYLEKNLSQCYFVHHKSHVNWSEIELNALSRP
jgi:hypothetical protein